MMLLFTMLLSTIVLSTMAACTPAARVPRWTATEVDNLVLAQQLVSPRTTGPASAVCTADFDASERHVAATNQAQDGGITVFGLLAETDYTCHITAGLNESRVSFRTGPLPAHLPAWEVTGEVGWGAYTLFNHGTDDRTDRQPKLLIVDPEGGLRWYLDVPFNATDLDSSYLGEGRILYGGGYAAPPTIVDLAGQLLLRAPEDATYHHHVEELPTGEFLVLTTGRNTDGVKTWPGIGVTLLDAEMASPTWTWTTQRGVDEGWLRVPTQPGDPYHINSVQVTDTAVYANFRQGSLIAKLSRTTGDLEWLLGPGPPDGAGDFTLVDADGAPDDVSNWFYGAHAAEHDGNRILLHDNGYFRPGGSWSRVAEFEIDEAARTAKLVWSYTEPGWYEPIWGDVDRLPDGNVLYTRAHCGTCRPGDPSTTQLVEVDPTTQKVVWRLTLGNTHDAGYRAERIEGCALFGNARYCDP